MPGKCRRGKGTPHALYRFRRAYGAYDGRNLAFVRFGVIMGRGKTQGPWDGVRFRSEERGQITAQRQFIEKEDGT
jgi:hypothetical protein